MESQWSFMFSNMFDDLSKQMICTFQLLKTSPMKWIMMKNYFLKAWSALNVQSFRTKVSLLLMKEISTYTAFQRLKTTSVLGEMMKNYFFKLGML